ncbi:MAG TPA: thioredoxin domain-containing protein [Thermoanaerobaculia bacterium]|jgi:thioredoxin 1
MTLPVRFLTVVLLFVMTAGAAAQQTFVAEFDVAGLTCDGCAGTATDALRKIPGVVKAEVTYATRRARVEAKRRIEEAELRAALAKFGFEARFPNDVVVKPLTAEERSRADIKVASRGEALDVRKHLARGKYTIFDFWAEWCGPCHVLTPKIERLVAERTNVALRTVDLKQWDSPAGKQATKEFKVPGLPYVRVYGPDGRFVGEVVGNDIEKIRKLIGAGE